MRWLLTLPLAVAVACTGRIEMPPDLPMLPGQPGEPNTPEIPGQPDPEPQPEVCEVPNPLPSAPVPMRRLTVSHVEQAVKDALGVGLALGGVPDERLFTFKSNISAPVDDSAINAYFDYAEKVSEQASYAKCTAAAACKTWLLDDVGPKLFRRPLEGELRTRYGALFDKGLAQGGTPVEGAKWLVQAMLQSPAFLYFDEPKAADGLLDGYAVATRLAQMFWGTNPDAALLAAAKAGELSTPEGVRAQAAKMVDDARSAHGFEVFVSQWLDLERLHSLDARPDLVKLGAPALAALEAEPVEVFRLAIKNQGSLGALFTAPRTVPLAALSTLYGTDIVSTTATETTLDPARRAGLLTLPGVMASLSHAGATSPTLRGHAILSSILCTPPAPPPAGVSVTLPETDPNASTRERLEAHFSDPSCASCHKTMDGMGFAFEHYDAVGAWRDLDKGKTIDDRSEFFLNGTEVKVKGAIELSKVLGGRAEVRECFTKQWTRYATGIPEKPIAKCFLRDLSKKLESAGGMRELMVELAASEYVRKGAAP